MPASRDPEFVAVPREPTDAMLRAALDARYQRAKRSQRVKAMFPEGYETWLRIGLKEDAPAIADEYKAMLAAVPDVSKPASELVERLRNLSTIPLGDGSWFKPMRDACGDAADRIEALEAALLELVRLHDAEAENCEAYLRGVADNEVEATDISIAAGFIFAWVAARRLLSPPEPKCA